MEFGISEAIFHRCRSQYGVVSSSEAKHLRELERECSPRKGHRRTTLDLDLLKEMSRKNF
jgi:hypothetical protein